jgi:hypothetical protein
VVVAAAAVVVVKIIKLDIIRPGLMGNIPCNM